MAPRLTARGALWLAASALALIGCWHAVLSPLAPLARLETALSDLGHRFGEPPATAHPQITIVDIDEASLQAVGRWPWPRGRLAALVDELVERQQVAGIGFDMVFAEPDPGAGPALALLAESDPALASRLPAWRQQLDQDSRFAAALRDRPVVLGYYLSADRGGQRHGQLPPPWLTAHPPWRLPQWSGYGANTPVLADAAPRAGFFNAMADDDGVVRRVPAVAQVDGQLRASLALSLWHEATGRPVVKAETAPAALSNGAPELTALRFKTPDGASRRLPLDDHGALRVPFRGPGGLAGGSFRYVPAIRLLDGQEPAGSLASQWVLIGSSAPGMADLRATPVHPAMPGVEVHAHLLAGLLAGNMPYRPSWAPGFEAAQLLLVLALSASIASRWGANWALAAAVAIGLALAAGHQAAFRSAGLVLPWASAAALGGLLTLGMLVYSFLHELEGRRALFRTFSLYLPPDRARQLARQPAGQAMAAENRELSVMFCDLRGFTSVSEGLTPDALRELLNAYFSLATEVVHAHGGTLDKFIGDAVMAFWGAPLAQPDHARRAVQAALALAASAEPLNAQLASRGLPPVRFGIGVATGVVCVGDLGSQLRRSYTAVGDAVNLAARLEALTREAGVAVLVDEPTRHACDGAAQPWVWVEVDRCPIRGRQQPVTVFTPLPTTAGSAVTLEAQVRTWHLAQALARQHHPQQALAELAPLLSPASTTILPAVPTPLVPPALATLATRLAHRLGHDAEGSPCNPP